MQGPVCFLPGGFFFPQQVRRLRPKFSPRAVDFQVRSASQCITRHVQARQVGVSPGVTQNDSKPQSHELLHKAGVLHFGFEFAQFSPVAKHQLAQAVQLVQGKARQVGVVQNLSAMLVVIAV